jgi:hypothetical protein
MKRTYLNPVIITIFLVIVVVVSFALSGTGITTAQSQQTQDSTANCAAILTNVEKHLSQECSQMDRDHVCYGNQTIKVELQEGSGGQLAFAKAGDVVPLSALKSITAGPLNPDLGEWGVAVLKVQARNLTDTASGQVVTFILYGDTTLTNQSASAGSAPTAVPTVAAASAPVCAGKTSRSTYTRIRPGNSEPTVQLVQASTPIRALARSADNNWVLVEKDQGSGWISAPNVALECDLAGLPVHDPNSVAAMPGMNAFYFSTGVGAQSTCKDIPPSGMLVHSPSGRKVQFNINGIDVTMGSTLLFMTLPNNTLGIGVLQGQAQLNINQQFFTLNQFQALQIGGAGGSQPFQPTNYAFQRTFIDQMLRVYAQSLGNSQSFLNQWAAWLSKILQFMKINGLNDRVRFSLPAASTPTNTPLPDFCTQRTFRPDGTVCIPQNGIFPCNRDGVCNNGEHSYICEEDCGPPPPPVPTCAGTMPC